MRSLAGIEGQNGLKDSVHVGGPGGNARPRRTGRFGAVVAVPRRAHGVRWQHTDVGYVADDAMVGPHVGHRESAMEVGAIPCQPTYASHEVWRRTALARAADLDGYQGL